MRTSRMLSMSLACVALLAAACAPGAPPSPTAPPADSSQAQKTEAPKPTALAAPAAPVASPATAAAVAASPATKPAQAAPNAELQKLIDGAKKEGNQLVIWVGSRPPEVHRRWQERFNQKFGLNVTLSPDPITGPAIIPRLAVEGQQQKAPTNVMYSSTAPLPMLIQRDLLVKLDWAAVFGDVLPDIEKVTTQTAVPEEARAYALDFFHAVYVIAYNPNKLKPEEVPNDYQGLLDPKYRGQFSVAGNAFPWYFLTGNPAWPDDKLIDFVTKLKQNQPRIGTTSPAIMQAVISGETPLAVTTMGEVREAKLSGAPVEMKVPKPLILNPIFTGVPKHAPQPNTAILFTAWMVTEGMKEMEELENQGRTWPDSGSTTSKLVQQAGVTPADMIWLKTFKSLEEGSAMREKLSKILAGV